MQSECEHGLASSLFCHKCWTKKHGTLEPIEQWTKRVCSLRRATKDEADEIRKELREQYPGVELQEWFDEDPS